MTINTRPPEATTYKPTYAKTRRRISISGIGMAIPLRCPDTVRRYESAISDLAEHGFEEEDYPVVDYKSDLQTDMSTTLR
ncbi:hypothetical protein [Oryza sativa Japonica Group]|uniref:Ulp1 protease-like n=1 Tax=Oryza sativa subsp. japonica TaxID=39947 RepID=Q5NAS1_ORYSJ|nr:hypothetical protein [Oryza sativa Japonica Group]